MVRGRKGEWSEGREMSGWAGLYETLHEIRRPGVELQEDRNIL